MFNYRYVNIAYGTLVAFVAPGEGPVYRPAKNDYERWGLYHPEKRTVALTDFEIPEGVLKIGDGAFENCFALNAVTIPESVTAIGLRAFRSCNHLREITFPSSVKTIRREAFAYCTGLTKLYIPDSVETIGESAFESCGNLQEIRLPDALSGQVKRIFVDDVDRMFLDMNSGKLKVNPRLASAITGIIKGKWNDVVPELIGAGDCVKMEKFLALWKDRPVSIEKLDGAIELSQEKKQTDLTALLMDYKRKHYTPVRQEAKRQREAERAMGLRTPTVADWQKIFAFRSEKDGVVIKRYKGEETLIEIPAIIGKKPVIAVESLFSETYPQLIHPYRIILPEGLREIRNGAFSSCTHLADIVIPKTVTAIGEKAFYNCQSLQHISIPEGVTEIQGETFSYCTMLASVEIPESVKTIYWSAFRRCENLKKVQFPSNVAEIKSDRWGYDSLDKPVALVPKGSKTEQTFQNTMLKYETVEGEIL